MMPGSVRDLAAWLRRGRRPAVVAVVGLMALVAGSAFGMIASLRDTGPSPEANPALPSLVAGAASAAPSPTSAFTLQPVASPSPTPILTPGESSTVAPSATPAARPTASPKGRATPTPSPVRSAAAGDSIAFHATGEIWTIRTDGSELTNLTDTPDVEESNPAWSADGALLAFQSYANGGGVDVMNADGTERRRVATGFPRNAGYFTDSLAWAPIGHDLAIAFVSGDVAIIDVETGDRQDVGSGTRWLAWSPSGRFLAWASGGAAQIYDRTSESLTAPFEMQSNIRFLNWFPDERRLLFIGYSGESGSSADIFTASIDGGSLTMLGQTSPGEDGPQLSPDGTRVLVSRSYPFEERANDDIALLELDGAEPASVLRLGSIGIARWAPDGSAAIAERDGRIFMLTLDGSAPSEIAAGYAPVWRPSR